jgi:hypothetical protein
MLALAGAALRPTSVASAAREWTSSFPKILDKLAGTWSAHR